MPLTDIVEQLGRLLRPAARTSTTLPSHLQAPDPQFIQELTQATGGSRVQPRPTPPTSPPSSTPSVLPAALRAPTPPTTNPPTGAPTPAMNAALNRLRASTGQAPLPQAPPARAAAQAMQTPQPGAVPPPATPRPPPNPLTSTSTVTPRPAQTPAAAPTVTNPTSWIDTSRHMGGQATSRPWWQTNVTARGISDDEFANQYLGGWWDNHFTLLTDQRNGATVQGALITKPGMHIYDNRGNLIPDGTAIGNITRVFNPEAGTFYNSYFRLRDNVRGGGIAKWMLKNQYALYDRMGITNGSVSAGLDWGGYVWAKFGFVPDASSWFDVRRTALGRLRRMQNMGQINQSDYNMVHRLLGSDDLRTLWRVSDLDIPLLNSTEPNMTVGKELLAGTSWHGDFSLRDQGMMERFNGYTANARSPFDAP